MENYITISHDPFGRFEILRRKVDHSCTCQWCGQPAKFEYGTLNDGINTRPNWDNEAFCGIQCRRNYHE